MKCIGTYTPVSFFTEKLKPTISASIGFTEVVSKSTDNHSSSLIDFINDVSWSMVVRFSYFFSRFVVLISTDSLEPIFFSSPENSNSLKMSSSLVESISFLLKSIILASIFTSVRIVTNCLLNKAFSLLLSNFSFIFSFVRLSISSYIFSIDPKS